MNQVTTIQQIRQNLGRGLGSLGKIRYTYSDPIDQYQARSLFGLAWSAVILTLLAAIYELATPNPARIFSQLGGIGIDPFTVVIVLIFIFSLFTLLAVTLLVNHGLLAAAGVAFVMLLFVASLLIYIPDGLTSFTMFALSMPIIGAGILLDRRAMLIILGLIALTLGLVFTLGSAGLLINFTTGNPAAADTLIDGLLILAVDGIMLNIYMGALRLVTRLNQTLVGEVHGLTAFGEVAQVNSLDELLEQSVDLIRDQLGYYHVQIFLVEPQTHLAVLRAGTGMFRALSAPSQRRIAPNDSSVINEVIRTGVALHIDRNAADLRRGEFLTPTQSELLLPLRRQAQILGVLDVQSIREDAFNADTTQVLKSIAGELSVLLQNARLMSEFQEIFRERQHLQEELHTATTRLGQLTEDVSGGNWARFIEQRGGKAIGFDWREGVLTSTTSQSPTIQQALTTVVPELITREGEQFLTVPIVLRGQTLGAMEFRAPHERLWNTHTVELARIIAQRLALAMDNIRLFEQAQITATREQVANQVAARLQSRTEIDALLAVAADSFQQALGATRTSILLGPPPIENISPSGAQLNSQSNSQPQHNINGGQS